MSLASAPAAALTLRPRAATLPASTRPPPAPHARRHDPLAIKPRSARAQAASARDAAEKNRPLVEDIRLLGRILGDVIRDQEAGPLTSWSNRCVS
jgi:hypothetical protein